MTKTKVVFVLPDFFAGGAQRVMLTFAQGLDRERFDVRVVAVNGEGPWREKLAGGLPVIDLGFRRVSRAVPSLIQTLRHEDADIVVSVMSYLNFVVLGCRPFLGRRVKIVAREANTPRSAARTPVGRVLARAAFALLYRSADVIVSPSELIASELADAYAVPRKKISVIPNPVDVDVLRGAGSAAKKVRSGTLNLVAVGRLAFQKGYDRLIETLKTHPLDVHVTIVGEGPEREKLEKLIGDARLGSTVTLAGFDANPAPRIAGADALLLPSRWEGLPNVALEALALGTPVLAAPEAGGIGEIAAVAEKGAVTIAPLGAAFAAAIRALERAPARRAGRSLLPRRYTKQAATRAFEDCLEQVLGGRRI